MKKLLSLLSVLTISGSAVPTTIAASPYQKEEQKQVEIKSNSKQLSRAKRSWNNSNNENKINRQCYWDAPCDYWLWISRDNWIKTKKIYNKSSNYYQFKNSFFNIIKNFWRECKENELWKIIWAVWNDFSTINNKYISSRVNYGLYMKIYKGERLARGSNDLQLQCWNNCDSSWYNQKIKLLGLGDDYKGEIGLDYDSKKILFFGNDEQFHSYFFKKQYNKMVIKDQNENIIKEIIILGNESMQDVISKYNLQNGINYDYGYIIEIWSAEPKRTYFVLNDRDDYIYFVLDKPRFQEFIIINDRFLGFYFYQKQYFSLLLEWKTNFDEWKNEINRQKNQDIPQYGNDEKGKALLRTWKGNAINELKNKTLSLKHILKTIENSENINKLKHKITKLQDDINVLKNKVDELYNKIEEIKNSSNKLTTCSNTFGLISPIASLVPVYGTAVSALTGIISASCTIANT